MKAPTVEHITFASRRASYYGRPRCEADVQDQTARWRMRQGKDDRCELTALYRVDGKLLCKRHAGDHLLRLLAAGEHVIGEPPDA